MAHPITTKYAAAAPSEHIGGHGGIRPSCVAVLDFPACFAYLTGHNPYQWQAMEKLEQKISGQNLRDSNRTLNPDSGATSESVN